MSRRQRISHWLFVIFLWLFTVGCIGTIVIIWWPDTFSMNAYKYLGIIGVWSLKILVTLLCLFYWYIGILLLGDELRELGLIEDADKEN